MYTTLVKNQIKKFQDYLIAKKGLGDITVDGYGRSLSIALRRMRKVCPTHKEIEAYILWMHKKNYSHSYICNTNYVRVRAVNSIGLRGLWKTVVKYFLIPYELQYY